MTEYEYKNLKRFSKKDHIYSINQTFDSEDIFEVFGIDNRVIFCKVKCHFEHILFDLIECDRNGNIVRLPIKKNSITHSEIIKRITENDWRLFYKQSK